MSLTAAAGPGGRGPCCQPASPCSALLGDRSSGSVQTCASWKQSRPDGWLWLRGPDVCQVAENPHSADVEVPAETTREKTRCRAARGRTPSSSRLLCAGSLDVRSRGERPLPPTAARLAQGASWAPKQRCPSPPDPGRKKGISVSSGARPASRRAPIPHRN